jgi:hypothetical protein
VTLGPNSLWPPNHKLVPVTAAIQVSDNCDPDPAVRLTSVLSTEPDNGPGDGDIADDVQDAQTGTDDRWYLLRAERSGPGVGRVYTVTYSAKDSSGNETTNDAVVTVSHDDR